MKIDSGSINVLLDTKGDHSVLYREKTPYEWMDIVLCGRSHIGWNWVLTIESMNIDASGQVKV